MRDAEVIQAMNMQAERDTLMNEMTAAAYGMSSVCQEAYSLVHGAKREDYGPVTPFLVKLATRWSTIINAPVTARQVWLMLADMKILREATNPKRDNRVDLAGYAEVGEMLEAGL